MARQKKSTAYQKAREAEIKRLQTRYNAARKTANRRMARLEKLAENPDYYAVLGYAYKNAANDLMRLGSTSKYGRFPGDVGRMSADKTNISKLKAYIATAEEFLRSESSTKTGIDKIYNRRADTLNKKMGTSFTGDDIKTWFDSSIWKKLSEKYGSKTAMKVIAKIQDNAEKIRADIEDARLSHRRIDIDELKDVDGLDINSTLSRHDKSVLANLVDIYSRN